MLKGRPTLTGRPHELVRLTRKVEEPRSRLLSHTQLVALPLRFGAATEPETVTACLLDEPDFDRERFGKLGS